MPNIFGIIANWGRWSEILAVKLPGIMSGSITLENVLSIRVLEWLVILVGFKIKGKLNSATQEILKVIKIFIERICVYVE